MRSFKSEPHSYYLWNWESDRITKLGKELSLREKLQEKCLGHFKLAMPTRYLSEATKDAIMSF